MENLSRWTKAHSQLVAAEYQRLGWTLVREFRTESCDEPYEYLLEWRLQGPPVCIDWEEWKRRTQKPD